MSLAITVPSKSRSASRPTTTRNAASDPNGTARYSMANVAADAERSDTAWPDADAPDAATPDGALADAGGDALVCGINADPADWVACCEAQSPENNAHCSAWGPPVPPAMEVA